MRKLGALVGGFGLRDRLPRSVLSVRTRFSLFTAAFLFIGIGLCFCCGRVVLGHFLENAETQVQHVGEDITQTVSLHAEFVRDQLLDLLDSYRRLMEDGGVDLDDIVADRKEGKSDDFQITLAARLDPDGRLLSVYGREELFPDGTDGLLEPYAKVISDWCRTAGGLAASYPIGIFRTGGISHYVTIARVGAGELVLIGRRFDHDRFVLDMRRLLSAMDIRWVGSTTAGLQPVQEPVAGRVECVVELRGKPGEAIYAMQDVVGEPVSVISVSVSRTIANATLSATSRMAWFFVLAGVLLAIPIFWLQGKILLNPLTRMTDEIVALSEFRSAADCPRIAWTGRDDEFAKLAESVNRMLERISARAVSVVNLERRHQALINGLPDALAIFDGRGRLVSITKEAEGVDPLPGLTRGEPPDGAVFGFPEADRFVTLVAETLQSGSVGQVRLKVQRPKGVPREVPTRHFELRLTRMDEHFVLAIIRDVSKEIGEHKLRLAAERRVLDSQKRESLTSLAAGIAHDMNNVLSIVLNAAEASDADPSGDSETSLRTIRDAVRRGTSMMRELQTFAGDNRIELHRVSPKLVLDDVMQLAARVVSENIIFTHCVEPDVPDVDVDPNQFWKVIFNILKNASEAIGDAPGRIRVRVVPFRMTEYEATNFVSEHPLSSGPGVLFCVEDDGGGIPVDILARLFDPYVSSKALGRGLGLATVRTIVEAHLGGIRVRSEPNRGTTFQIFLPASKSGKTLNMKRPVLGTAGALPAVSGGEVLVVDNDEAILKTTSILLKALKLVPNVAHDRREALAIVRRRAKRLKVILLDAHLGGVDTVRLLNAFRIGAPNVPVVVISGSSPAEMAEMFKPHPYDAFLAKPYTLQELQRTIAGFGPSKLA